jgi:hypothetical protein
VAGGQNGIVQVCYRYVTNLCQICYIYVTHMSCDTYRVYCAGYSTSDVMGYMLIVTRPCTSDVTGYHQRSLRVTAHCTSPDERTLTPVLLLFCALLH